MKSSVQSPALQNTTVARGSEIQAPVLLHSQFKASLGYVGSCFRVGVKGLCVCVWGESLELFCVFLEMGTSVHYSPTD